MNANAGAAMGVMILPLLFLILGVGGTVLWIWMIIDCATKERSEGNDKLVWILIIVLTHWIGALIYLLVRRPRRIHSIDRQIRRERSRPFPPR